MEITDIHIGQVVRCWREEVSMTQGELAKRMRAAGTKWSQATVWSVESGERPLRVSELALVANLCGAEPGEAFWDGPPRRPKLDAWRGVEMAIAHLEKLRVSMVHPR